MLFLDGRTLDSGLDYTPSEQPVGVSVWKAFAIDNHASLMYKRTSVGACRMLIKSVDRMIAVLRNLCLLSMAAMILSGVLCAQVDQGAIRGTVQDPTGAVVPSAKVTLTNEDTRFTLETTTSGEGSYSFTPIKIGTYTVAVERTGFQTVSQAHVEVHVNDQVKADFQLTPGIMTQTAEITAALSLLQSQSSTPGTTIISTQVNHLPLNGRNYTFLAQISAGVVGMQSGRVQGTGGFTANGLPWSHNSYMLDGIDNNNDTVDFNSGTAFVILTPPDAIQEVSVQTSNFTAEYGRAGSAGGNATTKTGTNQLRANFWEQLR